ncbi:MAG: LPP20 family lipoprotein [Deltaproteobacteria bacterium]|nr:MAG: LPP20 family lipoprotein [Deltaproteobacteria bacterium]
MKAKHLLVFSVLLSMAMVLVTACATPEKTADTAEKGPEWVLKGSGAFDVEGSKVFYGVGAASGIKNKALLRKTADNRARAEIAQTLETYVAYLAKDYMASTTAGDMSKSSEEQHVEQALKTFTKATLHGAQIVDRWQDPADGTYYALCELDMLTFKEALDDYKELDAKVRDYVRENAEKMHDELEELENQ